MPMMAAGTGEGFLVFFLLAATTCQYPWYKDVFNRTPMVRYASYAPAAVLINAADGQDWNSVPSWAGSDEMVNIYHETLVIKPFM